MKSSKCKSKAAITLLFLKFFFILTAAGLFCSFDKANLERPVCPECFGDEGDHEIVCHENYAICYRESYEQAEYSAYILKRENLEKNAQRKNNFRSDPAVSTQSASKDDYKGSGYDRGHLAPAGDFPFSEKAMSESFFMSNMSPQAPGLNRGIWEELESLVRKWAEKYGTVYVACGPVLEKDACEYETIGANKVAIPQYFYKVVLIPQSDRESEDGTEEDYFAAGFVFPNRGCEGTVWDYQVAIDEIEERTGLDFFSNLPDEIEEILESSCVRHAQ